MNQNPNSFSELLGKGISIALSLIVAVFFAYNFLPFPLWSAPYIVLGSFALPLLLARRRPSIPKPSKDDIWPLFCVLLIGGSLLLYFQKFPLFPEYRSVDFQNHVRIVTSYVNGDTPTPSAQMLYYGIEYILSLSVLLFGVALNPVFLIRISMVPIVAVSPLILYYALSKLFENHRAAWITTLVYTLSAIVWFTMPFNVGLYPNFYAFLASLFLAAASIDFVKEQMGVSSIFYLGLALLNALLSHYTVLLLFIPLMVSLLLYSRKQRVLRRGIVLCALLIVPIAVGLAVFQSILGTLFGFLSAEGSPPAPTFLSAMIPLPVLSYIVAEITNDWLSVLILLALPFYVTNLIKTRNYLLLMPLLWFVEILVLAPLGPSAWRFSYVALFPLVMMAGYAVFLPYRKVAFTLKRYASMKLALMQFALMALMIFPVFIPSWGSQAIDKGLTDASILSQQQASDYKAMLWMKDNIRDNESVLSVSNRDFTYSEMMGSRPVAYAPEQRVGGALLPWNDPEQMKIFALQHKIRYLVVTNVVTELLALCPIPLQVTLYANATRIRSGQTVGLGVELSPPYAELPGALVINDDYYVIHAVNGSASATINIESGEHEVFVAFGSVRTDMIQVKVEDGPHAPQRVSVSPTYCWPFNSFNPYTLGRVKTVYQDEVVKVLCLTAPYCPKPLPKPIAPPPRTTTTTTENPTHRYNLPNGYGIDILGTVDTKSINLQEGVSLGFHVEKGVNATVYFPQFMSVSSVTLNGSPVTFNLITSDHYHITFPVAEGEVRVEFSES